MFSIEILRRTFGEIVIILVMVFLIKSNSLAGFIEKTQCYELDHIVGGHFTNKIINVDGRLDTLLIESTTFEGDIIIKRSNYGEYALIRLLDIKWETMSGESSDLFGRKLYLPTTESLEWKGGVISSGGLIYFNVIDSLNCLIRNLTVKSGDVELRFPESQVNIRLNNIFVSNGDLVLFRSWFFNGPYASIKANNLNVAGNIFIELGSINQLHLSNSIVSNMIDIGDKNGILIGSQKERFQQVGMHEVSCRAILLNDSLYVQLLEPIISIDPIVALTRRLRGRTPGNKKELRDYSSFLAASAAGEGLRFQLKQQQNLISAAKGIAIYTENFPTWVMVFLLMFLVGFPLPGTLFTALRNGLIFAGLIALVGFISALQTPQKTGKWRLFLAVCSEHFRFWINPLSLSLNLTESNNVNQQRWLRVSSWLLIRLFWALAITQSIAWILT